MTGYQESCITQQKYDILALFMTEEKSFPVLLAGQEMSWGGGVGPQAQNYQPPSQRRGMM